MFNSPKVFYKTFFIFLKKSYRYLNLNVAMAKEDQSFTNIRVINMDSALHNSHKLVCYGVRICSRSSLRARKIKGYEG